MSTIYYNEQGYLQLVRDTLAHGVDIPDRTGVGCRALFDGKLCFDTDKQFPFSTVRLMPLRMAFEELWFFMRGKTQTKELKEKGINFWKGNTSREFLDKRGLKKHPEGDMGAAYGFQWRNFGGLHDYSSHGLRYFMSGHDQLQEIFTGLKEDPFGRRHYTTFWNPDMSHMMALTPCWHSHQFVVLPNENGTLQLHLKLINRSLDTVFGAHFAIQQYALYQMVMASALGMGVGKLSCDLTHIHVYENQLEYAEELVQRDLGKAGTVTLKKPVNTLEDILGLQWEDFFVYGLETNPLPFKAEKPPMAV